MKHDRKREFIPNGCQGSGEVRTNYTMLTMQQCSQPALTMHCIMQDTMYPMKADLALPAVKECKVARLLHPPNYMPEELSKIGDA